MKDVCPPAHTHTQVSLSDHWECLWNELPRRRHHNHHVIQRHRLPTCTDFHSYFFLFVSLPEKRASATAAGDVWHFLPQSMWEKLVSTEVLGGTAHCSLSRNKHFDYYCCCFLTWISTKVFTLRLFKWGKKKLSTRRTWVLLLMVTLQCKTAVHANYTRCLFSII